ncbi:hypothetical protein [Celeribacter halophilus]|uniref:hypothetical protein n=1 Tax=Celeribacter halophilus TaxID=576117 RepID=UPI003A8F0715
MADGSRNIKELLDTSVCAYEKCSNTFPYRRNKKYCSASCRVQGNRFTKNGAESREQRRRYILLTDSVQFYGEMYYTMPPQERLGFINDLVDQARAGNTWLREVLSNKRMLEPNPKTDRHLFYRNNPDYSTIAQIADKFCLRVWGAHVWKVVYNKVPEPPTGEVEE